MALIDAMCAVKVVDTIGRKWAVEVAATLESGPRRYNELLKDLGGRISPKVFTRVLRMLEAENIIQRRVVDRSPPGVQYHLTAFGRSLLAALDDLARVWAGRELYLESGCDDDLAPAPVRLRSAEGTGGGMPTALLPPAYRDR
jgi:DNA-binding HxlR family transcriptional regulator